MSKNLTRQRERIREAILADSERSNRSIASEVGCSPHTVIRVRERHVQLPAMNGTGATARPGGENLIEPAGPGNSRALTHGAHSEASIAPIRERHLTALRGQFAAVDERLLSVMAHRMAQYELLTDWLDRNGIVKGRGEVYGAAVFAERLARNFEAQFDRLREIQGEADEAASAIDVDALLDEHRAREDGEHDPEALPARNGTEA